MSVVVKQREILTQRHASLLIVVVVLKSFSRVIFCIDLAVVVQNQQDDMQVVQQHIQDATTQAALGLSHLQRLSSSSRRRRRHLLLAAAATGVAILGGGSAHYYGWLNHHHHYDSNHPSWSAQDETHP